MSTKGENKLLLIGHCAEPEIINTDNGTIAKFSLAINDSYTNKSGEKIEKTDWFKITCFNKPAEIVEKWLKKGQQLYVEAKLVNRKWQTKEGENRYDVDIVVDGFNTKIQMLGKKSDSQDAPPPIEEPEF